jgi:uncharacterized protein (TIGR03435 family)
VFPGLSRPGCVAEQLEKQRDDGETELLGNATDRIVVDRTGLQGGFAVDLEWSPDQTASDQPSIFTAAQEQLGLKLESTRGPVDVLGIDHVEKPTPD